MEWLKYPENKPENDIQCMCGNERLAFMPRRAQYIKECDVFLYLSGFTESVCLDVTHYFEIPKFQK